MQNSNTKRTLFSPLLLGLCALAVATALAGLPLASAHAVTSAEKQAEADALFAKIDALQTDLNAANESYADALERHDAAVAAMDEAQERIDEAEERIAELQARLGDRAVSLYKTGGSSSMLDVVLGSSTFEEFLTAWDMLERIVEQDAALVQETKDVRAEAQAAHDEYAAQEQAAADEMQKASDLMAEIEATQASLRAEADKITAEVAELQAQEELEAEAARQAAAAAESAKKGSSQGSSVASGSGIFTHPCPSGSLTSPFGYREFTGSFHKGVDFGAGEGSPYYAADSGTVIYATYDGGYNGGAGNWIVIAHGNGLVTKYMHSSAVFVSVGQHVERGEHIGAVGNTGHSFGAHLHFQVEVNGAAVDPMRYL